MANKRVNRTIIDGKRDTDNVCFGGKYYRIDVVTVEDGNPITDTTVRMAETDGYDGRMITPIETFDLI